MGFTGEQVDAFPVVLHRRKPWVLRRGWRLQRTDRRALAFLPPDINPAPPPASRRYLLPLALTVGPQGPEPSGARACTCTPMGAEPHPPCCRHRRAFYGSLGSEWAGRLRTQLRLQGREHAPSGSAAAPGAASHVSLPAASFLLVFPSCLHSRLTKPGAALVALGSAFPSDPEARPPCLLRSASSLRDNQALGPPFSLYF